MQDEKLIIGCAKNGLTEEKRQMTTHEYILKNWEKTIRRPGKDDVQSFIKMPCPYTTPTECNLFNNFYYWDTYFTNIGLIIDGLDKQAENNLDVMAFFIDKLGFMPNADHLIFASQPPFFTRGVYDLYVFRKDENIIKKYYKQIISELEFWQIDRIAETGLAQYKTGRVGSKLESDYEYFAARVGGLTESEKKIDHKTMARYFLAYGESGWDCNMRFRTPDNRFASLDFVMIDLNCILYDAENKAAAMLEIIGENEQSAVMRKKADERKRLIDKYLKNKENSVYLDYDFIRNKFSETLTVASLYPYAFGISDDKETCRKIFERLDLDYGISTAEYRGDDIYMQWDYPHMWAPNAYIAYLALKNTGNDADAEKLRKQYLYTVGSIFEKTGQLWEKYNAKELSVSKSVEYETPPMMGWTAAIYEYFYAINKKG